MREPGERNVGIHSRRCQHEVPNICVDVFIKSEDDVGALVDKSSWVIRVCSEQQWWRGIVHKEAVGTEIQSCEGVAIHILPTSTQHSTSSNQCMLLEPWPQTHQNACWYSTIYYLCHLEMLGGPGRRHFLCNSTRCLESQYQMVRCCCFLQMA